MSASMSPWVQPQGAANAYAQSQTTSNTTSVGTTTSSVTGSTSAFIAGQSASSAMGQVQQWWHDREEQSFDAVYVPTVNPKNHQPQTVVVNFAKEIHIDYDPQGRKIVYANAKNNALLLLISISIFVSAACSSCCR